MKNKTTKATKATPEPTKRLHAVPLAIPTPLLTKIRTAADSMSCHQADVMRLALEIGLRMLSNANYDQAGAIIGSVKSEPAEFVKPVPTPLRERRTK